MHGNGESTTPVFNRQTSPFDVTKEPGSGSLETFAAMKAYIAEEDSLNRFAAIFGAHIVTWKKTIQNYGDNNLEKWISTVIVDTSAEAYTRDTWVDRIKTRISDITRNPAIEEAGTDTKAFGINFHSAKKFEVSQLFQLVDCIAEPEDKVQAYEYISKLSDIISEGMGAVQANEAQLQLIANAEAESVSDPEHIREIESCLRKLAGNVDYHKRVSNDWGILALEARRASTKLQAAMGTDKTAYPRLASG